MSLVEILGSDSVKDSRTDINSNFTYLEGEINAVDGRVTTEVAALDTAKAEDSVVVKLSGNQTIAGVKTFSSSPLIPAPTTDLQPATKKYVDDTAFAGTPNASTTAKGIVEEATQAEYSAQTATGATGAKLFTPPNIGPQIEVTAGATHSLTTIAGQRVMVWVKGHITGNTTQLTLSLKYNGVTKDTLTFRAQDASNDYSPFSMMYSETPGAATQDITVTTTAGTLGDVVIMVLKF